MIRSKVTIINKLGLHARAAAKLVTLASRFKSDIHLRCGAKKEVNGKSIMGLMMLAASKGTRLEITVSGPDEVEALHQLKVLINKRFGERE